LAAGATGARRSGRRYLVQFNSGVVAANHWGGMGASRNCQTGFECTVEITFSSAFFSDIRFTMKLAREYRIACGRYFMLDVPTVGFARVECNYRKYWKHRHDGVGAQSHLKVNLNCRDSAVLCDNGGQKGIKR